MRNARRNSNSDLILLSEKVRVRSEVRKPAQREGWDQAVQMLWRRLWWQFCHVLPELVSQPPRWAAGVGKLRVG